MPKCYGCKKIFSETDMDGSRCKKCKEKHQQSYHKNKEVKSGYCIICYQDGGKMKQASFGLSSDNKKVSCSEHRTEEMVDLKHKNNMCIVCTEEGKTKQASFGLSSDMKQTHCSEHRTEEMIDLINRNNMCVVCVSEGKTKKASFGLISDMKQTHCSEHKTEEMIDLINRNKMCVVCVSEGKTKQASFGLSSDMKRTHCSEHKTDKMVDLINKNNMCIVCTEEGKTKIASFGLSSDMKKTHCSDHKTEEMIDLINRNRMCIVCSEEGKTKIASFGLSSDMKRTHCSEHKTEEMINLANINNMCIVCIEEGKTKQASFGLSSNMKKTHCSDHKTEEMVDLKHKNNMCIVCSSEGKTKQASFGLLFEKKTHCAIHKTPNMYSKNNPMCSKCPERPYYGDEKLDEIPVRCETHKKDTDIDMISKPCQGGCGLTYFIPSGQTMCRGCLGWERKTTNRGVKERKIATLLESMKDIMGNPVNNSMVTGGCSRHRPDFFYKDYNLYFHLIVEVDEFQHSKYSCSIQGEINRLINISENDTGGFPICVVRFNPDPYYYKEKTMKAYRGREETLKKVLLGLKNRKEFMHRIGVIYLYYDEYDETKGCKIEPLVYKTRSDGMLIVRHKHPCNVNPVYKSKL